MSSRPSYDRAHGSENVEAEVTYERYLHDYLRVFVGVNVENEREDSLDEIETNAILGIRYLTTYLFNLDVRIDDKLRPEIGLEREIMIFPRTFVFGMIEYQADFGLVNDFPSGMAYGDELTWNAGLECLPAHSLKWQWNGAESWLPSTKHHQLVFGLLPRTTTR